jgi:hypothetical protein
MEAGGLISSLFNLLSIILGFGFLVGTNKRYMALVLAIVTENYHYEHHNWGPLTQKSRSSGYSRTSGWSYVTNLGVLGSKDLGSTK